MLYMYSFTERNGCGHTDCFRIKWIRYTHSVRKKMDANELLMQDILINFIPLCN